MSDKLKETTSKRIKELRIRHDMTMEVLAEKIGVSKSTIAKWENGYVENMRQDNILKLALIFNVPATYIMGYDEATIGSLSPNTAPEGNGKSNLTDKEKRFLETYSRLSEEQKKLVENMMKAFLEK